MKLAVPALLYILLSACSVTHIDSNKDPNFSKRIKVLYIIIRGSHSSDRYLVTMGDYLREELTKMGITTTIENPNPLSLESEKEMMDRINKNNPDVLMVINQTEVRRTVNSYGYSLVGNGGSSGATFDIRLFQPSSDKPVYRANCITNSQGGQATAGKHSAKKIIEKLIADQVI